MIYITILTIIWTIRLFTDFSRRLVQPSRDVSNRVTQSDIFEKLTRRKIQFLLRDTLTLNEVASIIFSFDIYTLSWHWIVRIPIVVTCSAIRTRCAMQRFIKEMWFRHDSLGAYVIRIRFRVCALFTCKKNRMFSGYFFSYPPKVFLSWWANLDNERGELVDWSRVSF